MSENKKAKVLWISDLVTPTGFARVSHSILNDEFLNKFDVVGLGINYRGDPHGYKFPIYPASIGGRIFGEDRLVTLINKGNFDIVYILNDAWVVNNYLGIIKRECKEKLPKIIVYFPVDSENHDPDWYSNFDIVTEAVTYTEFAKSVVNDDNCAPNLKLKVIPHGIDTDVFYKKYTNRKDAKINLFKGARDPNSFIFLNANRNQPRKRLDITLKAFKEFSQNKDDVLIYMHCGIRDSHIDIGKFSKRLGIESKLILTNLNPGVQMVPDSFLNDIYNACDVGINTSMGEGWGLTAIEHAITGAPQIVPNHSACHELFYNCGSLSKIITDYTFDGSMTTGKLVSIEDLADKMESLYKDKDLYKKLSKESIDKFSDRFYSWKVISKEWLNLFEEVLIKNDIAVSN